MKEIISIDKLQKEEIRYYFMRELYEEMREDIISKNVGQRTSRGECLKNK